jgi:hypothetical protein
MDLDWTYHVKVSNNTAEVINPIATVLHSHLQDYKHDSIAAEAKPKASRSKTKAEEAKTEEAAKAEK